MTNVDFKARISPKIQSKLIVINFKITLLINLLLVYHTCLLKTKTNHKYLNFNLKYFYKIRTLVSGKFFFDE